MRPRKERIIRASPKSRFYKPRGIALCDLKIEALKDEEWEALLLADYQRHSHEEAAIMMGVSRPTFSRVLSSARAAVARALAEGAALEIGGGDFRLASPDENTFSNTSHEEAIMKIAFTTSGTDMSAPLEERFGRATNFLIYDRPSNTFNVITNQNIGASHGAGIKAAETIVKSGAQALVTGFCGPKATQALKQGGVEIYSSAGQITVEQARDMFIAGNLKKESL
jgi:predicted DNA-binding protein (UPF0251 family)/predicted Fe-Mo cluster-binding NifX family protein